MHLNGDKASYDTAAPRRRPTPGSDCGKIEVLEPVEHDFEVRGVLHIEMHVVGAGTEHERKSRVVAPAFVGRHRVEIVELLGLVAGDRLGQELVARVFGRPLMHRT